MRYTNRPSSRCGAVGILATGLLAAVAAASSAEPPPETVAGAGGVDEAIDAVVPAALGAIPPDFPGQQSGKRDNLPVTPVPAPPGREWFGGLPMWEWSRITGDWGGFRTDLEEKGVTVAGSFTIEWANAISGQISRRWVDRNLFDMNVTFATEPLFGWKGGTFFIDVASSNSVEGGNFVSGTQSFTSTIEIVDNTFQVANIWYQQELFDGALRIKGGKIDPTTEFGLLKANAGFLNLAALVSGTWLAGVPTYPYASVGGLVYAYPSEHWYIGGGAFDATFEYAGFVRDDCFDEGVWAVGETGLTWKELGPIRDFHVAFGGWCDTRDTARFDGTGTENPTGLYAIAEGRLFGGAEDDRGLWLFGQWGYADPSTTVTQLNYGGGAALRGTFPGRESDKVGAWIGRINYAGDPSLGITSEETAIELFYAVQVTPAVTFTPDIQFIVDPGGDETVTDPIVFTMRLQVTF